MEEPLSDYLRFECAWTYAETVRAGEDVRVIPVGAGHWPEGLPRLDYWLFDSTSLVHMLYDDGDGFVGAELVEDAGEVDQACRWRDVAVDLSIPFAEYAQRHDGRFRPLA
ncbi:DUF6879 family protein [Actinokineospora sp. 24-640]